MDNFEKRMILNYLQKKINVIDISTINFAEFFTNFIKEFNVPKKRVKKYFDEDDNIEYKSYAYKKTLKKDFKEIISNLKKKIKPKTTLIEKQISYIKAIYKLTDKEEQAFVILALKQISPLFEKLYDILDSGYRSCAIQNFLSIKPAEREAILESLYYKKLTDSKRNDVDIIDDWVKILNCKKYNSIDKIISTIMGKCMKAKLKLNDYTHIEEKAKTAINILKASVKEKRKGVNILLYGVPGGGKTEFAKVIAKEAKVPIYSVITTKNGFEEAARQDRLIDLFSKQYILSSSSNTCLLFDEAEDVMNTGFSFFNTTASKGYLNNVLENTPVPVIWTTNNISNVDPAFLRRMTYTIGFEKLSNEIRLNIWKKELKKNKFKIDDSKLEELNEAYDVSPSVITNAIQTVKMINGDEEKFVELIESVAMVVQKKKNIKKDNGFELKKYDISLVNADLDMKNLTDKILESGKLNFSLCLYGEPGTGKSEYAKYLANKLGIEVVYKKASDLMSMWVGGTEKNIANAFEEAKEKEAMLIFDEADSFLQNRFNAQRSWEVSQVNEMLTWMESHNYPFVCTTNLMESLDEASLRRFTFKVKFDFMKPEQVNKAMEHFFDIKDANINISGLTTGDFAVVKKKVDFLNVKDLAEIEKMLTDEVKVKKSPNLKNSVGF